jgi:hypothetical protein
MGRLWALLLVSSAFVMVLADAALAQQRRVSGSVRGGAENPPVVSEGKGTFRVDIFGDAIEYLLSYDVPDGTVTQAHLHVANPGVNGPIAAFLCANGDLKPDDGAVPDCPVSAGEVEGVLTEDDVLAADNLAAGDLDGLARLIRQSAIYVNVHTVANLGGEIRAQMSPRER